MLSSPRGLVLLINNVRFEEHSERRGAMVDAENMTNLFRKLHFEVQYEEDLKKDVSRVPLPDRFAPEAPLGAKVISTRLRCHTKFLLWNPLYCRGFKRSPGAQLSYSLL